MSRIENVQAALKDQEIESIFVSSPYNLRYVSNFTGTSGAALISQDQAFFITDFRYEEQAQDQAKGYEVVIHSEGIPKEVARLAEQVGLKEVGFEEDHMTVASYEILEGLLDAELKPVSGLVEELREIKEAEEVALIQEAIRITEKAYEHILDFIEVGMTELEVANELDFFMRRQGATGVSFDTIVASGVRSAMPHGVASEKKIEQGDMVTIDFGCYYKGYVSDMTRTFAVGDPGEELKKIYAIVEEAHKRVSAAAKPGITGAELDAVARDYITEQGYGEAFGHTTGHGIGVEVHEGPAIASRNDQPLQPGNVITNEPGIYIPGLGGVRIEDDILITEDGAQVLMELPHELIIL